MSHSPERLEKDCLNCGAIVQGRYCQECGQENILPHMTFWSLSKHFVFDILHFDGKFFDTLKPLLFKPGKVSVDYVTGKRGHYLDPIRMYLFTSAIFFLVFFSMTHFGNAINFNDARFMSRKERFDELTKIYPEQKMGDSANAGLQKKYNLLLDTTKSLRLLQTNKPVPTTDSTFMVRLEDKDYMVRAYKTKMQRDTASDSWLGRFIERKVSKMNKAYDEEGNKAGEELVQGFLHRLPYLLFFSLPIFALILKLLYIRHKRFYYYDHAIFTLHHYIFSFIILLAYFGLNALTNATGYTVFDIIADWWFLVWAIYLFAGMRRFYGQSWGKTLGKFLLLNLLGVIALIILFLLFILISLAQF